MYLFEDIFRPFWLICASRQESKVLLSDFDQRNTENILRHRHYLVSQWTVRQVVSSRPF